MRFEGETIVAQGYDGKEYRKGDRVELHPGTDMWMRGARFATVIGMSATLDDMVKVELDKRPGRKYSGHEETFRKVV